MVYYIGIDYSMSCPAVCVNDGIDNSYTIHYLTDTRKFEGYWVPKDNITIIGNQHNSYSNQMERFENIAQWAISRFPRNSERDLNVYLEDYAMGAKGKVFHIAECAGILKYLLHKEGIDYQTTPPTVLKKWTTGKGNAKKFQMFDVWFQQTNIKLNVLLNTNTVDKSPVSDIVDSYHLANYAKAHVRT